MPEFPLVDLDSAPPLPGLDARATKLAELARRALEHAFGVEKSLHNEVSGHDYVKPDDSDDELLDLEAQLNAVLAGVHPDAESTELPPLKPTERDRIHAAITELSPLEHLVAAAIKLSPSPRVTTAFQHLSIMEPGVFTDEDRARLIVAALLDGLQHGNWPEVLFP